MTMSSAMRLVASYGSSFQSALPVTSLTQNLTWLLVMILGTLVALNGLGVSIAPMLTALGIGGLAVALALQDPLSNLFAGLVVTLERQLRVGDEVKLDNGLEGCVVDFSWRSTRLRRQPTASCLSRTPRSPNRSSRTITCLIEEWTFPSTSPFRMWSTWGYSSASRPTSAAR